MRVVVIHKDANDILADTNIDLKHAVQLEFSRPPTAVRVAIVKDGERDQKRALCLIFT